MKSTEPNQGKYNNVSKSITHELKQINKTPVKKVITGHSASTYVKAAAKAAVCQNVDTELTKWAVSSSTRNTLNKTIATNARKSEIVAIENKPNDWFVSNARTFNVKSAESAKDILRLASSMSKSNTSTTSSTIINTSTTASASSSPSSRHLNNSKKVEIVSKSHINHSNSVKAPVTNRQQSINASNGQHQLSAGEQPKHSWVPAVSVPQRQPQQQPQFKASPCYINRPPAKVTNSLNGIEVTHPIERASTLQKSITNQTVNAENTPQSTNKSIESSKTRKNAASIERKYKQKDAKSVHEKRKNGSGGGGGVGGKQHSMSLLPDHEDGKGISNNGRKCVTNQIVHHESLQRLPLHTNELNNDSTTIANGITNCSGMVAAAAAVTAARKRIIGNNEWHSPDSYIYDEISAADTSIDCPEQISCMQMFWFRDLPNGNLLTREQRLENKRDNLRRQAAQYAQVSGLFRPMFTEIYLIRSIHSFNHSYRRNIFEVQCWQNDA